MEIFLFGEQRISSTGLIRSFTEGSEIQCSLLDIVDQSWKGEVGWIGFVISSLGRNHISTAQLLT